MKMPSPFETLLVHQDSNVLRLTLNRPRAANAVTTLLAKEFLQVLDGLDAAQVRAVVLTGSGERAFCAGGDLKERRGMTDAQWHAQHRIFERMMRELRECPVPFIAAVNGAAYAGGCELALSCDFIYAARGVRFALTEVSLGIIPGSGGTQNLPRAIGSRRAKELILSGQPFDAEAAHAWGMVNRLCDAEELMEQSLAAAHRIAANAPLAVRQAKRSIDLGVGMSLAEGMAFEIEAYGLLVGTEDRQEGINAFNEKRPPVFKGH